MSMMLEALVDSGKMLPFLLAAYVLVGFVEYHFAGRMGDRVARMGVGGPIIGALVGCFPQCGFSVLAAALYTKRLLSAGTLLSVFLVTSDEAVPILLAHPEQVKVVLPLILVKVAIAIPTGLLLDLILRRRHHRDADAHSASPQCADADRETALHHAACCDHVVTGKLSWKRSLVLHPLLHTLKIFGFLLLFTVLMNLTLEHVGGEALAAALQKGSVLQPVLAALIGLIPNCFASVLLAELYVKGTLSFGALVAGLCAGSGLGIIVLIRENKNLRDTLFLIATLLGVSILWGMLWQRLPLPM